jgi:acetyltransferase EpsM
MNGEKIYILGCGGMAREAYQIFCRRGESRTILGFVVEEKYGSTSGATMLGLPVIPYTADSEAEILNAKLLTAIGSPRKKVWIESLKQKKANFCRLIHPGVELDDTVRVGTGSIITQGALFTRDIKIGEHAIINLGVSINHDVSVGDYCHIAPGVKIAGNVHIGSDCWIGIGATIIHNVTIGKGSFIAAGAVVTDNLPDGYLYAGVPAKPIRRIAESDWKDLI